MTPTHKRPGRQAKANRVARARARLALKLFIAGKTTRKRR